MKWQASLRRTLRQWYRSWRSCPDSRTALMYTNDRMDWKRMRRGN